MTSRRVMSGSFDFSGASFLVQEHLHPGESYTYNLIPPTGYCHSGSDRAVVQFTTPRALVLCRWDFLSSARTSSPG